LGYFDVLPVDVSIATENGARSNKRPEVGEPNEKTSSCTGIFVDREGHFVTALHVVDPKAPDDRSHVSNVRPHVVIRQAGGLSMSTVPFKVIDKDIDHDLALCFIEHFHAVTPEKSKVPKGENVDTAHPFASLAVSSVAPRVGKFVMISGFPLQTLMPSIQVGFVSAIQTYFIEKPRNLNNVLRDRQELLQIQVSANSGNSGGPVIDLESGAFIGVILSIIQAPLEDVTLADGSTQHIIDQSGVMLAAPASWVEALLERNNIKSEGVLAGKLVIDFY
jgi:S1-C subfamily serine protease